ncbi:MAG TPA: prolyl oligopeptidase family serine peptidase [Sandaracinaceae bacterium]
MRPWFVALLSACLVSCGVVGQGPPASPSRPRWVTDARPLERVEELDDGFAFGDSAGDPAPLHLELPPGVEPAPIDALEPYLEIAPVRLSARDPRGAGLLVLARHEHSMQVHRVARPLATPEPITAAPHPVVQASPVPGRPDLLTLRTDPGGAEDYRIDLVRLPNRVVASPSQPGARHGSFRWSPDGRRLAFTASSRDPLSMDLYVAPASAPSEARLARENEGLWSVLAWSRDARHVLARSFRSVLDAHVDVVDADDGSAFAVGLPGTATLDARMSASGELFVATDRGEEHVRLFRHAGGALEPLGAQPPWDVEALALSPDDARLAYSVNEDGLSVVRVLDLRDGRERALPLPPGVVSGLTWLDRTVLAFNHDSGTRPQEVCTYAVDRDELVRWTSTSTPGAPAEAERVRIPSHDGVAIPTFVYRPRASGPRPVLLWMHGGPENQHRPSYHPIVQYLASELGIAVIAPNVRGSRGYGRTFLSLDDGTKRLDAVRDVGAVLDWIETQPDLDAGRVAIHGASYGGFLVLASLVAYPDRFVAGSDQVGISDIGTFLENTRPDRRALRRLEYGDESDPETRAFLDAISPLRNAHRIRTPLFVAHGANDPRVPVGEALRIADAVRQNGTEVWLMVAAGEGHSFQRRSTRDAFYRLLSRFLERHLLGGARHGSDAP